MESVVNKVSEAELEILKVLWRSGVPMSFVQIREALGMESAWNTSTIQTLIKRLLDKAALHREKKDVLYYTPTVTRQEYERTRTKDLVNKVFGGDMKGLLSALLNNDALTAEEIEDLNAFWKARIKRDE